MKLHMQARRGRRGAALIEYGLLVAGVAIVALAAVSILGHKVTGLFATSATLIPGTQEGDNTPIIAGQLVQTDENGLIQADAQTNTVSNNLGIDQGTLDDLILDPPQQGNP